MAAYDVDYSHLFSDGYGASDLMENIEMSYDAFRELILEDGVFNTVDRQSAISSNMRDYRENFETLHAYFEEEGASVEEWNQFNKVAEKYATLSELLTRRLLGEDVVDTPFGKDPEEMGDHLILDDVQESTLTISESEITETHRSNETIEEEVDHLKGLMNKMQRGVQDKLKTGSNITDPDIKKTVYQIGEELETMNQDKAVVEFEEVCDFLKMMIKEAEDETPSDFESDDPERVQKAIEDNNNKKVAEMFFFLTDIEETLAAPNGAYDYLHREFDFVLQDFKSLQIEDQSTKDKLSQMIETIKPKLYSDEILVPKIVDLFEEAAWEREYSKNLKKEEEEEKEDEDSYFDNLKDAVDEGASEVDSFESILSQYADEHEP